jgi:DNA-binding XRE family transcriptional regulator
LRWLPGDARRSANHDISTSDIPEHSARACICDNGLAAQDRMSTTRLRKFRKSVRLTQREAAWLIGYTSQRAYSDMELGLKRPALGTALACCTLFRSTLQDLFPDFVETVEGHTVARARKLHAELVKDSDRESASAFLAEIIERLEGPNPLL